MASLSCMWTRSCVKSNRVNVKTPNIANMLLASLYAFFIHWKFHWEHLPALLIHINISANIIQFLGNPMFVLFFSLKHAIINTIFSCTWFQFLWFFFLFCYKFSFFKSLVWNVIFLLHTLVTFDIPYLTRSLINEIVSGYKSLQFTQSSLIKR